MTQYELIVDRKQITSGTFNDCWKMLIDLYGQATLADLAKMNINIQPVSA